MTTDQWLRAVPWVIVGLTSLAFALSSFVRAWRRDEVEFWPLPFGAVASAYLVSLAVVSFVRATNIAGEFGVRTEHRAAYAALWTAATISIWALVRWWREDGDE